MAERDFEELLRLFNKFRVRYCIVGAHAVAIPQQHGLQRKGFLREFFRAAKLLGFYRWLLDIEERNLGCPLSLQEKLLVAKRAQQNRIQLALDTEPNIRWFFENSESSLQQCLKPFSRSADVMFENDLGIFYEFDCQSGQLRLSLSSGDLYKLTGEMQRFGPEYPIHIELFLRNEKEKIHCFRGVTQIILLEPDKEGLYLISL